MPAFVICLSLLIGGQVNNSLDSCDCEYCRGKIALSQQSTEAITDNFHLRAAAGAPKATELAKHAEQLRRTLCSQWLGEDAAQEKWSLRCEVIVHADRASYIRAVGQTGQTTSGSTLVRFSAGKVAVRRIDLIADRAERPFQTLAHELVHVIFAERFPKDAPPRWAEEGAALLADTETKRLAHRREFAQSLRTGSVFRVHDLVGMRDYPAPQHFPVFYGQSLILVDFLSRLGKPADFVNFVDRSMTVGHRQALNDVYSIETPEQLETLWNERAVKVALASLN